MAMRMVKGSARLIGRRHVKTGVHERNLDHEGMGVMATVEMRS